MLRRLLGGLIVLVVVVAAVLALPLARMLADRATQEVYLDRLADADRFATLADRGLLSGRLGGLTDELRQYHAVYGIRAWLIGADGSTLISFDGTPAPAAVRSDADVELAVHGERPNPPSALMPGGTGQLLVAVPVGNGAEAIGAEVTLSPVGRLRQRILLGWAVLALAGLGAVAVLVAAAIPFSRWLLRPVARLDEAAGAIAAGRLESRTGLTAGPPELRRLADSFDRAAEVVERTLQRQQQFVDDASHQLRTPLTSLRLALDNLGAELPDEPEHPARTEYREAVGEAVAMGRMLDGLLDLTRLGSEPNEVEDLAAVFSDAEIGWHTRCRSAGLRLVVAVAGDVQAITPPGGVRHLLDELVENACRLSGGSTIRVEARREQRDGSARVVVGVSDDGRGLDAGQRAAAVQRFWRAPGQQNTSGSGLGLAIAAELTTAAGGRLTLADAAPGLRVELDLAAADLAAADPQP